MTTVIAVYTSEGLVGRCDAKCHEAIHPHCDCVCGGRNHGAFHKTGLELEPEDVIEMLNDWKRAFPDGEFLFEVQLTLPGFDK